VTCCGQVVEITDYDDSERMYLCGQCGKQGPAREFPDLVMEQIRPRLGWTVRG
jgi:hypothetical protein